MQCLCFHEGKIGGEWPRSADVIMTFPPIGQIPVQFLAVSQFSGTFSGALMTESGLLRICEERRERDTEILSSRNSTASGISYESEQHRLHEMGSVIDCVPLSQ